MDPAGVAEAAAEKLDRLAELARAQPQQVYEAWLKLRGESPGHPDPYWLRPEDRRQFAAEVASDLGVSIDELLILDRVITVEARESD